MNSSVKEAKEELDSKARLITMTMGMAKASGMIVPECEQKRVSVELMAVYSKLREVAYASIRDQLGEKLGHQMFPAYMEFIVSFADEFNQLTGKEL